MLGEAICLKKVWNPAGNAHFRLQGSVVIVALNSPRWGGAPMRKSKPTLSLAQRLAEVQSDVDPIEIGEF